jgi:hypothetical protein
LGWGERGGAISIKVKYGGFHERINASYIRPMHWFPRIQVSGTGLALVSSFAPTLGIEIPYAVRATGFLIGILMVAWPASVYVFSLIRRAEKMWLIIGMGVGAVLFLGCALALYLGLPKEKNQDKFVIFEPFKQFYDMNPRLGRPVTHEVIGSVYFATYEQGLVIYLSSSNTHYVLPRDQTKNVVISRVIDIPPNESPYFKDESMQRRLKIPSSKRPPVGGIAVEWEKNPKQWEWLGGREWQLVVGGVHDQYFEN